MAKTRFKVECEIEVEYAMPEGIASTPYTHISGYCKNGTATIATMEGKITNIKMKKLKRLEENKNE